MLADRFDSLMESVADRLHVVRMVIRIIRNAAINMTIGAAQKPAMQVGNGVIADMAVQTKLENKPVKVDAQGSFSFAGLPQGWDYEIFEVTIKGYGRAGARG